MALNRGLFGCWRPVGLLFSSMLLVLNQGCAADRHMVLASHSLTPTPRSGPLPMVGAYGFELNGTVSGSGCVQKNARFSYIGFVGGIRFTNEREAQAIARAASAALLSQKEGDLLFLTRGMLTREKTKVCAEVFGRVLTLTKAQEDQIGTTAERLSDEVSSAQTNRVPQIVSGQKNSSGKGLKSGWGLIGRNWLPVTSGTLTILGFLERNRGYHQLDERSVLAAKDIWTTNQRSRFADLVSAEDVVFRGQFIIVMGLGGLAYVGAMALLGNR